MCAISMKNLLSTGENCLVSPSGSQLRECSQRAAVYGTRVREPSAKAYFKASREQRAGHFFPSRVSSETLHALTIERVIVDCLIAPIFGKSPADIEFALIHERGIAFFESKQKYPFWSKPQNDERAFLAFGLGLEPHVAFFGWAIRSGV